MRRVPKAFLVLSIAFTLFLSGGSVAAQQSDVRAAIEAGNKQFLAALSRGDGAGMAAVYGTNAQVFPPNSDIVSGSQAIQKFWQDVVNSGVKGATLTTLEAEEQGDTAYEVGKYALTGEAGKVLDTGKYVTIWKREQGQWKLHRDIWNTNAPAPGK
jgi:ketosteroid isomerase-like protein